jgi:hypothetical protein
MIALGSAGVARRRRVAVGMGLLTAAVVSSVIAACANVSAPEGGPEDRDPPVVMRTSPANRAIVAKPKDVVIQFDEVVSEAPRGAPNLAGLVFISPKAGAPVVDWQRSKLSIRPKKGWKPNTVYSITVNPGIADLRGNQLDSTIRIVFSTGGPIPDTRISGVIFDWAAGKGAPKALVEAIAKDSTAYQVLTDSSGRFDLRYLPPGPYRVRGFIDRNSNRDLDPLESWDSTAITITSTANIELYTFTHDTVGLRIAEMTVLDSGRVVKVTFDKPYAPDQVFHQQSITIKKSDSTNIRVNRVETVAIRALRDSLAAKARADSAAAKKDTSAAGRALADSLDRKRRLDSLAAVQRADREARRLAQLRGNRPPPPRDTTPPPKMSRPLLYNEVFAILDEPLPDGAQLKVQAVAVRSLSGTLRSPSRTLTTPKVVKKDSTATSKGGKKDSTAGPPRKP